MPDAQLHGRRIILLFTLVAVLGLATLWWLCDRSPKIPFLSPHGSAEWIIYPRPPDGLVHQKVELDANFHRAFTLDAPPAKASLSLRAFRRFEITLNGARVEDNSDWSSNWKQPRQFDISKYLRPGTNYLSVTVFNSNGPPALWLSLDAGTVTVNTDSSWDASLAGAAWRPAWIASRPLEILPGNELYSDQNTFTSLGRSLPLLLLFAVLSTAIVLAGTRLLKGIGAADSTKLTRLVFLVIAVFWVALFFNNLRLLPYQVGFDADAHLDYINFIKKNHKLPLANDGWEMCQAPLYYMVSALVISPLHSAATSDAAIQYLRLLGLVVALAQIWLVLLCLRLLFPGQPGKQIFGLVLAGCVPELLYISQYVSNESMAALWVTAAIYFCLRLFKEDRPSWQLSAAAGACLGAALLSKVTTVIAIPFLGGAVFGWLWLKRTKDFGTWMRTLGVATLTCFAVSGWHYIRVWAHFGSPIVNDWDPASGFAWWTDQGFSTAGYYTRFGQSLIHPFYSGFQSFADGIYSTLWGDSLYGGMQGPLSRPAWNYNLMAAGFLLALFPTAIIMTGVAASVRRFIHRPEPIWFLLLGLPCTTIALLVYLNLKLPFCCAVKAFYGLMALLPLCAFGAIGWDVLIQRAGRLRVVPSILMGIWAMTAIGSFWIRGGTAFPHVTRGLSLTGDDARYKECIGELSEALRLDPHDTDAKILMAVALYNHGSTVEAQRLLTEGLAEHPNNADAQVQLASILAGEGKMELAVQHAQRAIALGPDWPRPYHHLCAWYSYMGRKQDALTVGGEGLRLNPMDPDLHFMVGRALAALTNHIKAVRQLNIACEYRPGWAAAHDALGISLMSLRRLPEATHQFNEACRWDAQSGVYREHLARLYAETGDFKNASDSALQAVKLAKAAGDKATAERIQKLLDTCVARLAEASQKTGSSQPK